MFLTLMVIGLAGLATMSLPALNRHGAPPAHPHGLAAHAPAPSHGRASHEMLPASDTSTTLPGLRRWVPSPRAIFTALALYGAFANALVEAFHFAWVAAAFAATIPTLIVERWAVRPVWNLLFRLRADPSAPLGEITLNAAVAVVPFRNGRGVISTCREGRVVQLAARLCDADAAKIVRVGDRLQIEEVDAERERVTVSFLTEK